MVYEIRIQGNLDETWINWFSPLILVNDTNGEATLTGAVRDQSELAGLLGKVFDLNLTLLSVNRMINSVGQSSQD